MVSISDGQCGACAHFGGDHANDQQLVQIRISHQAEPDMVQPCGLPDNAAHALKVSPLSGCDGFTAAKVA